MEEGQEPLIKRGVGLYLYYLTIPLFFVLVLINYYSPIYNIPSLDLNLMISIVTFLFGFFISISFSMILNRVSLLKSSLAIETGRLVSLFKLSKHLGNKFHEKIKEYVDNYTVNTLREYYNYNIGRDYVYGIYEDSSLMELKTEFQKQCAQSFFYILGEFEPTREQLEYLTQGGLLWAFKISNYLLGGILVILLFLNRGSEFTNMLFIILSSTIFFILLIIQDYEALRIGDYTSNISNSEQLFDLIEVKRYYPKYLLGRVQLERGKIYRVGIYDKSIKKERVINMRY